MKRAKQRAPVMVLTGLRWYTMRKALRRRFTFLRPLHVNIDAGLFRFR